VSAVFPACTFISGTTARDMPGLMAAAVLCKRARQQQRSQRLSVPAKVLAMAESCKAPPLEPDELRVLLAEPNHCLARLARDLFATPEATAATLEACAARPSFRLSLGYPLQVCRSCFSYVIIAPLAASWTDQRHHSSTSHANLLQHATCYCEYRATLRSRL